MVLIKKVQAISQTVQFAGARVPRVPNTVIYPFFCIEMKR